MLRKSIDQLTEQQALVTLYLTPVFFTYMASAQDLPRRRKEKRKAVLTPVGQK